MKRWEQEIENDLKWRQDEIASLKHHAISVCRNEISHRAALRALWAMLYAHFEGFTKFCWDLALDEIEKENVKRCDLVESLTIVSLESVFSAFRGNTSSESIWTFFSREFAKSLTETVRFADKCRLSTESNLWPNVFAKETSKLGITCREIESRRQLIKSLVARRNEIAHGKFMTIKDLAEYKPYEDAAFAVMYELALATIELLERQDYLRK
jgi:hypothetical protein